MNKPPGYWTIPREWDGETVYIVGGGPSVLGQNLDLLRGKRVIVVNARYIDVPWADYLFGIDSEFFDEHRERLASFTGRMVTTTALKWSGPLLVRRATAPGHDDPSAIYCSCTSLAGASDLARWLNGGARQVWLGADGRDTPEARKHHSQRYPKRPHRDKRYDDWRRELKRVVAVWQQKKIEILNATPGSAYGDFLPEVKLEDVMPFNPNDFHEDMSTPPPPPVAQEPVLSIATREAISAARVALHNATAKGKDRVKLKSAIVEQLVAGCQR